MQDENRWILNWHTNGRNMSKQRVVSLVRMRREGGSEGGGSKGGV